MFRWIFKKQLAEIESRIAALKTREASLDSERTAAQEFIADAREKCREGLTRVSLYEERASALLSAAHQLTDTITTSLVGFNARFNQLEGGTAANITALRAGAAASVAEIKGSFQEVIDARVRTEIGKWAFSGGAGRALAAMQYCARCATRVAKWSMIPEEGPVCAKCLESN